MMGNLEIIRLQNYFSGSTLERLNNIKSIITDTAGRATALQQFGDTEHENRQAESINLNTRYNYTYIYIYIYIYDTRCNITICLKMDSPEGDLPGA